MLYGIVSYKSVRLYVTLYTDVCQGFQVSFLFLFFLLLCVVFNPYSDYISFLWNLYIFLVAPTIYPENVIHHVQRLIFEKNVKSLAKRHSEIVYFYCSSAWYCFVCWVFDSCLVIVFLNFILIMTFSYNRKIDMLIWQ